MDIVKEKELFAQAVAKMLRLNKTELEQERSTQLVFNQECVKVWNCDFMRASDLLRGSSYVKNLGYNVLVYNNIVFHKADWSSKLGVQIFDGHDLQPLLIRSIYDLSEDEILYIERFMRVNL